MPIRRLAGRAGKDCPNMPAEKERPQLLGGEALILSPSPMSGFSHFSLSPMSTPNCRVAKECPQQLVV